MRNIISFIKRKKLWVLSGLILLFIAYCLLLIPENNENSEKLKCISRKCNVVGAVTPKNAHIHVQ